MTENNRGCAPHEVDIHVGGRLRATRKQAGYSLGGLAQRVGVTFQQLQKYEKGANRLSASRLYQFAHALEVPITTFYEGLSEAAGPASQERERIARFDALMAAPGGCRLLDALLRLPSETRQHLASFIASVAPEARPADAARPAVTWQPPR